MLFGGTTGSDNRADTWTWDGQNWSLTTPASSPPARNDAAMGFDTTTQSVVLFGGSNANAVLGDTWLWNGSNWSTSLPLSVLPALNPPARSGASLASGPSDHRLVLFGGQTGGSVASTLSDTWTVATLATAPPPTTTPSTSPGPAGGATTSTAPGSTTPSTKSPTPTTKAPPTSTPATRPAAPRTGLAVTARSVHRGQQVTVSGSGFVPGAVVTITFHSARVVVGTTIADARGHFTATVSVPADLSMGTHRIEADGAASSGGRTVLIAQVSITAPGGHIGWMLPTLMVVLTVPWRPGRAWCWRDRRAGAPGSGADTQVRPLGD